MHCIPSSQGGLELHNSPKPIGTVRADFSEGAANRSCFHDANLALPSAYASNIIFQSVIKRYSHYAGEIGTSPREYTILAECQHAG